MPKLSKKEKQRRASIVLAELKTLFPTVKAALDYTTPWQCLVAIMLSAQTTDKQVNVVTPAFFAVCKDATDAVKLTQEEIETFISSIGLYRSKAKHVLAASNIMVEKWHGNPPRNFENLIQLPGVGRKTANVFLAEIYKDPQGIAVDTHVKRLANKFGLVQTPSIPKIEKELEALIPKEEWNTFTLRMIEYGRNFSPAKRKETFDDPVSVAIGILK